MSKIKSLEELRKLREEVQTRMKLRENSDKSDDLVRIKVAMATCGIASGARETMRVLIEQLDQRGVDAVVTQTGCMGYCYAEPTVEVTLPGKEPIVFGEVKEERAREIIDKYVVNQELIDGIIPVNHQSI
ncbi:MULTISPECIES: (2Fe-2S) ferredoxin domain-containing protein [Prolixibacter]|jgi:NADP-reducing hydrogenase subunit HndB|uniref:NADP oxidoreductase n=1 Tax=Prolixibacter denitrificans TaxID=1541063 RepID=A0A2P8CJK2_9BACT|nr:MULTISPECIES: (2Fe-2S) ferredoxin domain-containing protein [Prolixibacter]PSK85146.1 NADP-reducing hydrogenase subunit HndB [Prolixibacter denitrificans]GET19771.1 NADP oxidoreductase [Prolixibacter denitrificans]GET26467.1 NADP oxidoreductase [Prolixibacter sp. NT017]